MYTVTLPSGKTYTYGAARYAAAVALAGKTGGVVTRKGENVRHGDPRLDDDGHDAWKDERAERGAWRRY